MWDSFCEMETRNAVQLEVHKPNPVERVPLFLWVGCFCVECNDAVPAEKTVERGALMRQKESIHSSEVCLLWWLPPTSLHNRRNKSCLYDFLKFRSMTV